MRKTTTATLIVVVVGALVAFVMLGGGLSPERRFVDQLSKDFMEDLQFKDFRRSASYHHKLEHDRVDIGKTLEKFFMIKPESLDIQSFRIVKSEMDSSGDRARVHIRARVHRLNMKKEPEDAELILYWMKRNPDCPIGAACKDGSCINPAGEALYFAHNAHKPLRESEAQEVIRTKTKKDEPDPQKLTCEPGAEPRWFMNLDSTLEEKRYNY